MAYVGLPNCEVVRPPMMMVEVWPVTKDQTTQADLKIIIIKLWEMKKQIYSCSVVDLPTDSNSCS